MTKETAMRNASLAVLGASLLALPCACSSSSEETAGEEDVVAAGTIVFNELSSTGRTEWLEIANKSTSPIDLGGYGVADTDKNTKLPKVTSAMRFPVGTVVAPGGYLLVVTGMTGGPGPYTPDKCITGSSCSCYYAAFGISASDGEAVHLLSSRNSVITSAEYPKNLKLDASAGETACRMPDLTGEFAVCQASPGGANAAK
jgi:hypothetical protein